MSFTVLEKTYVDVRAGLVYNASTLEWERMTQPLVASGVVSTKTALTASSPTFATVGTSSAEAVASNANRKGLMLKNTSANTISIAFGVAAVLNSGITLDAGENWYMNEYTFTTAQVRAIASGASSNLAIQEYV